MPRRLKVYVIDDSMELCRDVRGWLSEGGHTVSCSPAGRTLVHTLLEYQPNLIVLGMTRYAGEGLDIYRRLGNHRQLRQVPLIVISDDAALEYEMLDAFDFQIRPLDRQRLHVCLKRLAGSRRYLTGASFSDAELSAVKSFLHQHSGLHFSQHNQRMLERGLMRRIQALCMESLPAYCHYLSEASNNYDELNKLLSLLTVGETSFFRYRSHREALVQHVFPRIIARNRGQARLRIWSAGCSTGEEPYSLAIMLMENFPELVDWDVRILATDINKRVLRHAREGVYGERSLRMMEEPLRQKYFQKLGHHYLLSARIRRMVHFDYLNLQTDEFPSESNATTGMDLLLCRNVLIYFELETIRRIVEKFSRALNPQGFLFMGHAETMQNVSEQFQRHHQSNAFFYQLKNRDAAPGDSVPAAPGGVEPKTITPHEREKVPAKATTAAALPHAPPPAPISPKQEAPDPDQLRHQAITAFEHEKYAEAGKLFDQLLELQPDNPRALVGKGMLLANQGHHTEARICCARAIRVNDLLPEAYLLRGLILDMEGFLERALVEYQKVLWLDPSFIMAHYLAARVHARLNDPERSQRSLRNTARMLEQADDQATIPFSGGLSRGVFLEIVRSELIAQPIL